MGNETSTRDQPMEIDAAQLALRTRVRAPSRRFSRRSSSLEPILTEGADAANVGRDAFIRRSLGAADLIAATLAVVVGVSVLGSDSLRPLAVVAVPLALLVSKVSGLYDRDEHLLRKSTIDEIPVLFSVATLFGFLLWLAGDLVVEGQMGREQAAGVWALLFVLMFAMRSAARSIALRRTYEERCLLLGDERFGSWVARKLLESQGVNARILATLPLEPLAADDGLGNDGKASGQLEGTVERNRIERVIIAPDGSFSDDILDLIRQVKVLGVKVSVLPRLFEVVGSSVEFDEVDGLTLLGVRRYGLTRSSELVKRALDLLVAGIGLIAIAPVFLLAATAIKLDSPGPAFFRQRRMGRHDVPFAMLKFRTMTDGADRQKGALRTRNEAGGGLFKIEDDPRITRVGGFLRRASLDELPQLINVLRGEMSLVGPRPLVIDEDVQIEGWRRRRLQLPPGMTGLWQIYGSARIPMDEMVKIDYRYGANWSLWLDIKILLQTVPFVLGRRGL